MTVIGVVGEDQNHFWVVTKLVDDALVAGHVWLQDVVESCRTWRGLDEGESWHKYRADDAYDLRPLTIAGVTIKPQGWIAGEPLKPEAGMWRNVLLRFCHADPVPEIVVLARDLDGYPDRLQGIEQVRSRLPWPFAIVVAAPEPEIEAWIVSGFTPRDDDEHGRLDAVRRDLSFDPTLQSHRLTAHPNDARTDAKLVLRRLGDDNRHRACVDRDVLRARGEHNGARAFIDEIDERIVPVFGGPR